MTDYAAHRAKLVAAIERRRQAERARLEPEDKPRCTHSFKHYRQTLPIDNIHYRGGDAYLVLLACELCREKRPVDYVVG